MRSKHFLLFLAFAASAPLFAGGDDADAVLDKAIKASGGAANIEKFNSSSYKEKGLYYGMGEGVPYTSVITMQYPDKLKLEITGVFTLCLDGDKGWIESNGEVKDMPKDEVEAQTINNRAGWMASLVPLKDKAFTLKSLPDAKVEGKDACVVQATRKDYPDVKLYFDKTTFLLVKSEFKSKLADQGNKEVMMENFFSSYKEVDGAQMPHKYSMRRDGKLFVETDIESMRPEPKLDPKTFAKP